MRVKLDDRMPGDEAYFSALGRWAQDNDLTPQEKADFTQWGEYHAGLMRLAYPGTILEL